jgi:hypothetical protein
LALTSTSIFIVSGWFVLQYQTCLRKFRHNHDATILTFLARAHFKMGDCLGAKTVLLKVRIEVMLSLVY